MKFNFKPLSSFFKSTSTEEDKEEKNESNDQGGNQGDNKDDAGTDQGNDQVDDQEEVGGDQEENAGNSGKESNISITQAEYKGFVAAQVELQKFGKNAEDRNNFLKDASQLQEWYAAAARVGATSNSDANAAEKSKKLSKVTSEAKAAYEKSASAKKK